jgi:hypothetical protein
MTQYQPVPTQKRPARKTLIIVLVLVILAYPAFQLFLFTYTGVRTLIADQETHEVVYKVTGTAEQPNITFARDGHRKSEELTKVVLPWESAKLTTKGSSQVLSVSAIQQDGGRGTVKCEIWMDGKLVTSQDPEQTAPGLGLSAYCTHAP